MGSSAKREYWPDSRPVTPKTLAKLYHQSESTFISSLQSVSHLIGEPEKGFYSESQVCKIFQLLGFPHKQPEQIRVLPGVLELLVNASWNFGCAVLWGGRKFSRAELVLAMGYIERYYLQIPPEMFASKSRLFFTQFCERLLLAKSVLKPGTRTPHPCIYLNPKFKKGFVRSKSLLEASRFKARPNQPDPISQMAELYAEHIFNPSPDILRDAIKVYSYRNSNLLLLFCSSSPSATNHPQRA